MRKRLFKTALFALLVISGGFLAVSAHAATLYFYPQNISLVPGQEALIDIRIDAGEQALNAIELEGGLSGVAATLRDIDNSGSAIEVFVERPSVKGKAGFRLVGGVSAGLTGEHVLARIVVRGELPGNATLSFDSVKTQALLADGTGDSVPLKFIPASIRVSPKTKDYLSITSVSHPDQNQWYTGTVVQLHFDFDPRLSYSYVVTHDPLEDPDDVAERPEGTAQWQGDIKLKDMPEGVTYFAVKKVGSSAVSRYRFMIDTSKPVWEEVKKNGGTVETEGRPFLTFLAQDALSGVEYYEMRVDGGEPVTVASPEPLPDQYTILSIRAYDRAGNYIEQFIPGPKKNYSVWIWAAVLFVLLVWVSGIIDIKR